MGAEAVGATDRSPLPPQLPYIAGRGDHLAGSLKQRYAVLGIDPELASCPRGRSRDARPVQA